MHALCPQDAEALSKVGSSLVGGRATECRLCRSPHISDVGFFLQGTNAEQLVCQRVSEVCLEVLSSYLYARVTYKVVLTNAPVFMGRMFHAKTLPCYDAEAPRERWIEKCAPIVCPMLPTDRVTSTLAILLECNFLVIPTDSNMGYSFLTSSHV